MLTVKTVAQRLSLSKQAVYDLCTKGLLPHYKLGGAIRISEEQLKAFLAEREVTKPERGNPPRKQKPPRPALRHLRLS